MDLTATALDERLIPRVVTILATRGKSAYLVTQGTPSGNGTTYTFSGIAISTASAGDEFSLDGNVLTRVAGGGESFVTDGLLAGRWVTMTGWDDAENNSAWLLSAVTATTLTLAQGTLTDVAAPGEDDVTIRQDAQGLKISPPSPAEARFVDGSTVRTGDVQCLCAASGLTIPPAVGLKLHVDDDAYTLHRVDPIRSGQQTAAYRMFGRLAG